MIYLDNAATTKCYKSSAEILYKTNVENYYNASALYKSSADVSKQIKIARENIKKVLHAPDGELYFMSGGTEADNMALFCTRKPKNSRIIVSLGEHDAIINSANELKNQGFDVVFCPINHDGSVNIEEFKNLLNGNVSLVSIMQVSNETGAINDIKTLVKLTKKTNPDAIFHCDGVQAFGKIKVNLRALGVDLYTISGHKIHAPKGIGALFIKKGVSVKPLIYGGGQEKGMRSGTEISPLIFAFNDAITKNFKNFDQNYSKKQQYIEQFKLKLTKSIENIHVISPIENVAPHILTVAFEDIRGEVLLHSLEKFDILVGIGSACSSHHESRFKSLLGLDDKHRDGIVRFSVSEFNSIDEIDFVIDTIKSELETLTQFKRV